MKVSSIKKNFMYNLLKNVSMILFPMITFPYLSRIIGVDGIGKNSFADSVIQYFILLSSIGIPLYGTREVAKCRDDREKLTNLVNELFQINIILTVIFYIIFLFFLNYNSQMSSEKMLFLINSLSMIFIVIGVEWFFQGIEEYEYITKRTIIIRVISILIMLVLIKKREDYLIASLIGVLGIVGGNIFNFFKLQKYIEFKFLRKNNFKKHLKPLITGFWMNVAISIYANLDLVMLGFINGNKAVGIYAASIKFSKLIITVITSLGVVLVPRLSYYIQNNLWDEYKRTLEKALNMTLLLSLPSSIGLFLLAKPILLIFSGKEFLEGTLALQIVSPIVLFIPLINLIGMQILYTLGKEKIILISAIGGALINFMLNYILMPKYSYIGAATATCITELIVLGIQLTLGKKYIKIKIYTHSRWKYILSTLIMALTIIVIKKIFDNLIIEVLLSILIGSILYFWLLIIMRDKMIKDIFDKIIRIQIKLKS